MDKLTTKNIVVILVIIIIMIYYFKKRTPMSERCVHVWSKFDCVECRQLFFEHLNTIDNNGMLKQEVELFAETNSMSYYNAKVVFSAKWLKENKNVTDAEGEKIIECESQNNVAMKIVK